jgi:two-component system, chemotaxis family, response regulator Rcp1
MNKEADTRTQLLVIEDNPADIQLLRFALDAAGLNCELTLMEDGGEALAFFKAEGDQTLGARPDLVILDLNLPKYGGLEVLEAARANPRYSDLPILVFSSSSSPRERGRLEALGMARYFTKPADLQQYLALGDIIRDLLTETTSGTELGSREEVRD